MGAGWAAQVEGAHGTDHRVAMGGVVGPPWARGEHMQLALDVWVDIKPRGEGPMSVRGSSYQFSCKPRAWLHAWLEQSWTFHTWVEGKALALL